MTDHEREDAIDVTHEAATDLLSDELEAHAADRDARRRAELEAALEDLAALTDPPDPESRVEIDRRNQETDTMTEIITAIRDPWVGQRGTAGRRGALGQAPARRGIAPAGVRDHHDDGGKGAGRSIDRSLSARRATRASGGGRHRFRDPSRERAKRAQKSNNFRDTDGPSTTGIYAPASAR